MADTEYKLAYDGPQIDTAVGRALPGGEIDAALESKAEIEFLDNTDFTNPVAQAGIGGMHGSVAYAVDRWKLISGTVSADSNGLTLNGTIRQIRENSIGFPVVPSIEMYSGTAAITYDDSTKYCDIVSSGGVVKRPHLGLTAVTDWSKMPMPDRDFVLRKCQNHYFDPYFMRSANYAALGYCRGESATSATCQIAIPNMRTYPVLAYSGTFYISGIEVTGMAIDSIRQNLVTLITSTSGGLTASGMYNLQGSDENSKIAFIADL